MNAIKFAVVLVIGVLCAIVTARPVEEISKETKLGVSTTTKGSKTTTKGLGAELQFVRIRTQSNLGGFSLNFGGPYGTDSSNASAPYSASSSGSGSTDTTGSVTASGPNAAANSTSGGAAQGSAGYAAGPGGAIASGSGSAESGSNAGGRTSN